jgi:putative ABC transport system permease protein
MIALLRKVYRDVATRRARSALTILAIAVGVGSVVAIVSMSRNLERAQRALFASTSQADLLYYLWDAPDNLALFIRQSANVEAAELRTEYSTRWLVSDRWMDIRLVGLSDPAAVRVNRFDLIAGTLPEAGEILLEESAARGAGVDVGQQIGYRDPSGRTRDLRVSGISRTPNVLATELTRTAIGYVDEALVRRLLNTSGANRLLVRTSDPTEAQATGEDITRYLRQRGIAHAAPIVRDPQNYPGKRELDALVVVISGFSAIGLVVSGLLVFNTLSATVAEQVGEVAVLKAIGATQAQILLLYQAEALAYGLLGTLVGVGLGALGGWQLLAWVASLGGAAVPFRLAPEGLVLGTLAGMGATFAGGMLPALRATRLTVHEGISSYGISAEFGRSALERRLARVRLALPMLTMGARNLARRRGRSILTLLVVAFATAALVGAVSTRNSVNRAIEEVYTTYRADAWVTFGVRTDAPMASALAALDGVVHSEGWLLANGLVDLANARLWGLPADSTLYRHVLAAGRWFRPDEVDTVVLSTELAAAHGIGVGDWVEIQANGRYRAMEVVGLAIDNTIFLGGQLSGKAFMPREALARFLNRQGEATLFALGMAQSDRAAVDEVLRDVEFRFRAQSPSTQPIYEEIESAQEASRLLTLALVAMVITVAVAGALGVVNTLTLNVLERQREIAIMRAVGGTNLHLVLVFVAEGLLFGGLGWLVGVLIGYPVGRLLTTQMSAVLFALRYTLELRVLILSGAFALLLATVASVLPALGAARVSAAVTLRYE